VSSVVLSDNRDARIPELSQIFVDYTQNCPREWFTKSELGVDLAAGRLGLLRPHYGRVYDPAIAVLEAEPADVVLLYEGHYASATLPRWRRVRESSQVCLYVHNPLSRTYGRRELRRLIDSADRVAFCAEHLMRDTERRLGRSDPRLEVVHNGVEHSFFAKVARRPTEEFVVVFAGNFSEQKGIHVLLEAVALLEGHGGIPRMRVRIVGGSRYGDGAPNEYEYKLRSQASSLATPVEFTGWTPHDELPAIFSNASAVCLPSLWSEGFPLVALEAMASGTPVACSDSPGMMEAVGDVGFVHHMGNAEALAEHLSALATDAETWRQRSGAGIARASRFTWEAAAMRLAGVPQ